MRVPWCAAWTLLTVALLSVSCTAATEPPPPRGGPGEYAVAGTVVRQLDASRVTLAHDAIKNYMPAMVMDVAGDNLPALQPGDRIRATLVVGADTTKLTDVAVVKSGRGLSSPTAWSAAAAGAIVPDVVLSNQFDESIRISDFRGHVLLVTFIYTRCPLPDFCPRLLRNFQEFRRAIADQPSLASRVHMLAVSIDPEFDTPDVLRAYGEARLGRKHAFERLDLATGHRTDVTRLAMFFGLRFEPAAGQISHALVTAIVGRDGRLLARFPEMTWNVDEALAVVERETARGD